MHLFKKKNIVKSIYSAVELEICYFFFFLNAFNLKYMYNSVFKNKGYFYSTDKNIGVNASLSKNVTYALNYFDIYSFILSLIN